MSRHHRALPSRRWARFARQIKDRDGWRCQIPTCGRRGRLEVDHIVPLEDGGDPWDPDNCWALCGPCHATKTGTEARLRHGGNDAARTAWQALIDELR